MRRSLVPLWLIHLLTSLAPRFPFSSPKMVSKELSFTNLKMLKKEREKKEQQAATIPQQETQPATQEETVKVLKSIH